MGHRSSGLAAWGRALLGVRRVNPDEEMSQLSLSLTWTQVGICHIRAAEPHRVSACGRLAS